MRSIERDNRSNRSERVLLTRSTVHTVPPLDEMSLTTFSPFSDILVASMDEIVFDQFVIETFSSLEMKTISVEEVEI